MWRGCKYWVGGVLCLILSSAVTAEPSEKIRLATQKILQSLRTPHMDFTTDSPEDPFAIQIKTGKFNLVGSVSLNILLGECFSEGEKNEFKKFFTEKFLREHPNCLIEIISNSCLSESPLKKAVCSLQRVPCSRQKYGEMKVQLRCLLPIEDVDLFSKEERVYQ
ncbi:MAG: hypothetical protein B7Y25_05425 [Alphaproteobacteria bacterium 16-39-46]|nr:MAG: hypothetical protein B7Y25_05425 [Alphaproteobacteria bacterium 16-39-46]OZA42668.1 MAG: hypothetical protein B7X84_05320 [Alphaproteobacteria bacterium 17-39-52]